MMPSLAELVPGAGHTYSKVRNWPDNAPTIVRGSGGLVWGADGTEFVDWGMGINNVLIGHAEPEIDDAVIAAIRNGQNFSRPSVLEEQAASVVLDHFGRNDWMIKFCKNGSDANNAAVRLARAVTGRQQIAFDGSAPFFSTGDWWCSHQQRWAGTLDADRAFSQTFRFNDSQSVRDLRKPLACVILELARDEKPTGEFLQELLDLQHRFGTLIVVDEVVTGYRYASQGLSRCCVVWPEDRDTDATVLAPDLVTLGKGMGNGHSVSALMGKREHMKRGGMGVEDVFLLSTTHGAEQHGLAAAVAVTQFYQKHPVIEQLASVGNALRNIIERNVAEFGVPLAVISDYDCRPMIHMPDGLKVEFYRRMIDRGILLGPWACPCYRRTFSELERTEEAIRIFCKTVANRSSAA